LIATACPTTDEVLESEAALVIVVVVEALLTVWETPAEVLVAKLESPAYVAVIVLGVPTDVEVSKQLPAATVAVQLALPSLTVTFPVGVPLPGGFTVTLYWTVYACPTTVAVARAVAFVIVVVVLACVMLNALVVAPVIPVLLAASV